MVEGAAFIEARIAFLAFGTPPDGESEAPEGRPASQLRKRDGDSDKMQNTQAGTPSGRTIPSTTKRVPPCSPVFQLRRSGSATTRCTGRPSIGPSCCGHRARSGSNGRSTAGAFRRASYADEAEILQTRRGDEGKHDLRPRKIGRAGRSNASAIAFRSGASPAGSSRRTTVTHASAWYSRWRRWGEL